MKKCAAMLLAVIFLLSGFSVNVSAATVKLNKSKKTIYVGETFTLTLKNAPSDAKITWKSSKKSVATVDKTGVVTAKKNGKTTITAKYGKKTYKCKITVKKKSVSTGTVTDFSKAKTGDYIVFGSYEQDNNLDNGTEPIEWLVLSNDGSELYVISKYALDSKPYNIEYMETTWEICTLRKWLNEDFYNTAFTEAEKEVIKTTKVKNDDNPEFGTYGGSDTMDNVFLPSIADMVDTNYGFISEYHVVPMDRMINRRCAPTAYAKAQGEWTSGDYITTGGEKACYWWLRSPGGDAVYAARVADYGDVDTGGDRVYSDHEAVRPAIVISLNP